MKTQVVVYHNWGRWVANCPQCPNAEHYGADSLTGHVGGLTNSSFRCSFCGFHGKPKWPDRQIRSRVEQALASRPSPANRNWQPGESLELLAGENIEHGVLTI